MGLGKGRVRGMNGEQGDWAGIAEGGKCMGKGRVMMGERGMGRGRVEGE